MNAHAESLAGIIMYSPDPDRLIAFYRDQLGVPLAPAEHGTVGGHFEGRLGGVHFAVWDAKQGHASAPLVTTFRVANVGAASEALLTAGATRSHKVIDLGEGKRIVGFVDPDGRPFRLIEIA